MVIGHSKNKCIRVSSIVFQKEHLKASQAFRIRKVFCIDIKYCLVTLIEKLLLYFPVKLYVARCKFFLVKVYISKMVIIILLRGRFCYIKCNKYIVSVFTILSIYCLLTLIKWWYWIIILLMFSARPFMFAFHDLRKAWIIHMQSNLFFHKN